MKLCCSVETLKSAGCFQEAVHGLLGQGGVGGEWGGVNERAQLLWEFSSPPSCLNDDSKEILGMNAVWFLLFLKVKDALIKKSHFISVNVPNEWRPIN